MNPTLRRQQIGEMVARGEQPDVKTLATFYQVHASTIYKDLRELRTPVGEMIGRTASSLSPQSGSFWDQLPILTTDATQVDYGFWGRLRRNKAKGYELGGLFARPIGIILTAWIFGEAGPKVSLNNPTSEAQKQDVESACADFLRAQRQAVSDWVFDSLTLGDGYAAVNVDASLTNIPPNQVKPVVNELNIRDVRAYRVISRTEKASITDEYRVDGRTLTMQQGDQKDTQEFRNLTGRLPVVHLANERETNELFGHPVYEGLLTLFALYHDLFTKSADGVKVMGHPIPVVENLEDPEETIEANKTGTRQYTDADGVVQEKPVIDFSVLDVFYLGKGGRFTFAQPGSFVSDAEKLLQYLFLLMLQHILVPEWVWGGAIASSKASVDGQMPAFVHAIGWRRSQIEPLLLELVRVWLATQALYEPSLRGAADLELQIKWPALTAENEELKLKWATEALKNSLIQPATFVAASGLAEDAAAEVAAANQAMEDAQTTYNNRVDAQLLQEEIDALRAQLAERTAA